MAEQKPLAKVVDFVPLGALSGPGAPDPDLDHFQCTVIWIQDGQRIDGLAGILKSNMLIIPHTCSSSWSVGSISLTLITNTIHACHAVPNTKP